MHGLETPDLLTAEAPPKQNHPQCPPVISSGTRPLIPKGIWVYEKLFSLGLLKKSILNHDSSQLEQMELPNQEVDLGRQKLHEARWNSPLRTP